MASYWTQVFTFLTVQSCVLTIEHSAGLGRGRRKGAEAGAGAALVTWNNFQDSSEPDSPLLIGGSFQTLFLKIQPWKQPRVGTQSGACVELQRFRTFLINGSPCSISNIKFIYVKIFYKILLLFALQLSALWILDIPDHS